MSDRFESLTEEKKKRILEACIEEFASKGYDNASTNSIVNKAEISKGILFHYFGNKKSLFLYVFDYALDILMNKYLLEIENEPKDIFERLMWFSMRKIKIIYEEPQLNKLVFSAVTNIPEALKKEITERYNEIYSKFMPKLFSGIDTSTFRKDINPQKAIEVMMTCLDGISNKYLQDYKNKSMDEVLVNFEKAIEEYKVYLNILKYGVCEHK